MFLFQVPEFRGLIAIPYRDNMNRGQTRPVNTMDLERLRAQLTTEQSFISRFENGIPAYFALHNSMPIEEVQESTQLQLQAQFLADAERRYIAVLCMMHDRALEENEKAAELEKVKLEKKKKHCQTGNTKTS